MNIVDSSLWIEYFLDNDLDAVIINTIEDTDNLYVPSVCLYEVHKKFLVSNDIERVKLAIVVMQYSVVIGLDARIAILASALGKQYKLPMADSIIYATAQIHNAEIYTQDKHFKDLKQVRYFDARKTP
jgi:toxin FitB